MEVNAHPCPGTHHLPVDKLFKRGVFPLLEPDGTGDITVVLFEIEGVVHEFRLIDECIESALYVTARLIPQEAHSLRG